MELLLVTGLLISCEGTPPTDADATPPTEAVARIEPPSWWIGMRDRRLQLMVYGLDASTLEVKVDHPGVRLIGTEQADSTNYLFVNLRLDRQATPGLIDLQFWRDDKLLTTHQYPIDARDPNASQRKGFGPEDVIYLITPDRFANGDRGNDENRRLRDKLDRRDPYGRHGGDLQGVLDNLDYLVAMGYSQLWFNPLLTNDQTEHSYHGYAQTDLFQIDPRYGDNALYQELVYQAGQRGIGVIKDIVLNHIGSEHWWMGDLPATDWINQGGEYSPTNHFRETLHDPHGVAADLERFQAGWFVPTMPDLNQRNPLLARYLIQNTIWWIEYAGLSGLRIDTFPYPDRDFTETWSKAVLREYPKLSIVGEEWSLNPAIVAYWQLGTNRHDDFSGGVPNMMDFPLHDALMKTFNAEDEAWNAGLIALYQALANDFQYAEPHNLVIFPDNHDMSRIFTQLGEDQAKWRMAMTFLLTTRGIPQLFYGTEIQMTNKGTQSHGVIRSDFPGGWSQDRVSAFTGNGLKKHQRDAQAFLKRLLNWRRSATAIHDGKLTHYAPQDGIYVYFRHNEEQRVMVVINRIERDQTLALDRFNELIGNASSGRDVMTEQRMTLETPLKIPAQTALILELQP